MAESAFRPDLFARKRVLVTGGATGIGRGIANAFATHGAHVIIMSRNEDRLKAAAAELGRAGMGGAEYAIADVRDAEKVQAVADEMEPLDILINCAAGNFPSPFSAMSKSAWDTVIDIVLGGTVHCSRSFGQRMHDARGDGKDRAIVNILAGYAWTGAPGVSHSGAAKAGVLNLTKSLAVEWAPVRVNAVSPGPIGGTEGMKRLGEDLGLGEAVDASIPLGHQGDVDDIGAACLYLGSSAAKFVTGANLVVDGGQDAVGPFGGLFMGALSS